MQKLLLRTSSNQKKSHSPFQALKLVTVVSLMLDLLLQIAAHPQRGQGFKGILVYTIVVAFPLNADYPNLPFHS